MNTQDKIKLALERNNLSGAKKLTVILLEKEHKSEWSKAKQAEYNELFPATRNETYNEYVDTSKTNNNIDNTQILSEDDYNKLDKYIQVPIKYITQDEDNNEVRAPTNYQTYSEWINETKVVIPEVQEVSHIDDNGMKIIDTPYQAEVIEQVRPYTPLEVTDELIQVKLETLDEYHKYTKKAKSEAKEKVVVTQNKIGYQGDPMSINYMSAVGAIGAMRMFQVMIRDNVITAEQYAEVYKTDIGWKGSDNKVHTVQIESVVEACEKAMQEQAKVVGVK